MDKVIFSNSIVVVTFSTMCLFLLAYCKKNNTVTKKNNLIIGSQKAEYFIKNDCPCKMPRKNERYGIINNKKSLIDNQKELVIKLCQNDKNSYAISLESLENKSERGKIYDYKPFETKLDDLEFFVCNLEKENLFFIFTSSKIHSKWRVSKGKLIALDQSKYFPCMDSEVMEFE